VEYQVDMNTEQEKEIEVSIGGEGGMVSHSGATETDPAQLAAEEPVIAGPIRIVVDMQLCTGCQSCMLACSFAKTGGYNPRQSRIRLLKLEESGVDAPMVCQQCENARCIEACPVQAISRSEAGIVVINETICTGCGTCMTACPCGAIGAVEGMNKIGRRVLKCDLCGGKPSCVPWCETHAIRVVNIADPAVAESLESEIMFKKRYEIENDMKLARYFDNSPRGKALKRQDGGGH